MKFGGFFSFFGPLCDPVPKIYVPKTFKICKKRKKKYFFHYHFAIILQIYRIIIFSNHYVKIKLLEIPLLLLLLLFIFISFHVNEMPKFFYKILIVFNYNFIVNKIAANYIYFKVFEYFQRTNCIFSEL